MSQGREYQTLFSYLRSLNFHFLDTWVIECVNFYKSINPNISIEELKAEVKQQWLLVDLRKLKVSSLPPDLASINKIILDGKYAVQVESMIDCSESCYSQFLKVRKVSTENIEATKEVKDWDIKSNRCLALVLSDGVQEVQAMEYQPIKKIRTNDPELLPGFKMVIVGPVECRKGMILLKEENVRICGGEVDTLTATNNLKSILIKKLDLNEEDYPETSSSVSPRNDTNGIIQTSLESQPKNCEGQSVESLLSQNDDVFLSLSFEPEAHTQTQTQEKSRDAVLVDEEAMDVIENDFNDDIFNNAFETVDHEHDFPVKNVSTNQTGTLLEDCGNSHIDVMDIDEIVEEEIQVENLKPPKSNPSHLKKPVQTKLSYFFKGSDSPGLNTSYSAKRTIVNKPETPVSVNINPFVYLKQITEIKLRKPVIYTIKAIILTLTKKITIQNDEFSLKARITDGSLTIDVNFCSEILEEFLDFSPCEMITMMKVRQTNSAIADRLKEAFTKAQEKLISLNCLMNVKFFPDDTVPLVVSLEEVNAQHLDALQKRSLHNSELTLPR